MTLSEKDFERIGAIIADKIEPVVQLAETNERRLNDHGPRLRDVEQSAAQVKNDTKWFFRIGAAIAFVVTIGVNILIFFLTKLKGES